MGLFQPLSFNPIPHVEDPPIPNNQDISKDDMDIFYRNIYAFIPEGKTWEQLTSEEKKKAMDQYKYDYLRPGVYQGITGIGRSAG